MRICLIIDAWEPIWGGGQTHVLELSKQLVANYNYEIDIITRSLKEREKNYIDNEFYAGNKIKVIRVGPTTSFFNFFGRLTWPVVATLTIIKKHQFRHYQVIHGQAYIGAIPTALSSYILKIPSVFTVHGSNYLDLGKKSLHFYSEKFLLTKIKFNQVISVSQDFLKIPNVNKKINFISNGTASDDFYSRKKVKKNIFTILWVGRFDKIKAVDLLIKSFQQCLNSDPNLRLRLVGYGYEEENLRKLVLNSNLQKYITFVGKKPLGELHGEYINSDLFILPSLSEGFSITLLEAMAHELPVLVTPVGENKYLIKSGYNGYLTKKIGDQEELTQSILRVKNDKNFKLVGKRAAQSIKKYTWKENAKKTNQIYKKLLK